MSPPQPPGLSHKYRVADLAVQALASRPSLANDQTLDAATAAILATFTTIEESFEADGDHAPELAQFAGHANRQRRARRIRQAQRWKADAAARCALDPLLAGLGARLLAWLITYAIRAWLEYVSGRDTAAEFAPPEAPPEPDPEP